jgi:hypothetical protein
MTAERVRRKPRTCVFRAGLQPTCVVRDRIGHEITEGEVFVPRLQSRHN